MDIEPETIWKELREIAKKREGVVLLLWLADESARRRIGPKSLGFELGMKFCSLRELYSGQRSSRFLTRDVCIRLAVFLNVPVITILLAAGIVTLNDFFLTESETALRSAATSWEACDRDCQELLMGRSPEETLFCAFLAGEARGAIGLSQPSLGQQLAALVRC